MTGRDESSRRVTTLRLAAATSSALSQCVVEAAVLLVSAQTSSSMKLREGRASLAGRGGVARSSAC